MRTLPLLLLTATLTQLHATPPNVLMIVIDDMSASAIAHPAYGQQHPSIQTPSLDRLCNEGLAFTQAYSNWPACMPARHMFMSGMDVEKSGWRHTGDIRNDDGRPRSAVYLHQHFQANGYSTLRLDKVFHIGFDVPEGWDITEEPFGANRDQVVTQSSELSTLGLSDNVRRYAKFTEQGGENSEIFEMDATDESGVPIDANRLTDGITKLRALELLDDLASPGGSFDAAAKPFFLAVGFRRPHLPFAAPREYYGRYKWGAADDNVTDPATPEIVLPPFNSAFTDEAAYRQSLEGYYACTTMTDDHVGALLDKLDATGLADNTIVLVFGDNGYGLGEHNKYFSKGTPDNVSYHVPLIIRLPDGTRINQTEAKAVTLLDIYPTLVDLCGLPQPATPIDGQSLAPLIEAPDPNWVEHAYAILGGSADPSDPLAAVVWAKGYKYYETAAGSPSELYAVGNGDRFEWTQLINNSAFNSIEAELKARLDSFRARSAARIAPELTQHATSQAVPVGAPALFTIRNAGAEVLTCTWSKDGVLLPAETATSLLLPAVGLTDAGVYLGTATDTDGRTLSYRTELKVIAAAPTLFDWQIDESDAPFILDGLFGGSIDRIAFLSNTFGPAAQTCFTTNTGGRAFVRPGLPHGSYRVSLWNPTWGSATTTTTVHLRTAGGDSTVVVDQKNNANQWYSLGNYTFGPASEVEISTDTGNGRVALDGLRFERLSVPANTAPVATDDGLHVTPPDTPVVIDLLANDADADPADTLSILQCSGGRFGAVTLSGGLLTYTPRPGVTSATETLRYQVTDGKDRSNPAELTITIEQPVGTSAVATETNGNGQATTDAPGTTVANGSTVNLTATAFPGYQFYYWDGPQPSLENPLALQPVGNATYRAVFRPIPETDTYAEWAALQPWNEPADANATANPDGDPWNNRIEFGLDLAGTARDSSPYLAEVDPLSGEFVFRFRRSLHAPEGTVTVWTSPDLSPGSWQRYTGDIFVLDFDPDGDFSAQELEVHIAPNAGNQFIRLNIAE